MGEDPTTPGMVRHTVSEAADMLGITTGAVRNRLSRRTLRKVKEGGTVYVLLPADMSQDAERDTDDTPGGMPSPEREALTSELRDRLRYVEEQLEAERQAHAEARRIIAGLVERMPPQLEAPAEATPTQEPATPLPNPIPVAPEQSFGLKVAGGVAAWLGGIFAPLAISVLSAQDARYRAALVFAVIAVAGVFLVGTLTHAVARARSIAYSRHVKAEVERYQRAAQGGAESAQRTPTTRTFPEEQPTERVREPARLPHMVRLALFAVALPVLAWLAYLVWWVFFA